MIVKVQDNNAVNIIISFFRTYVRHISKRKWQFITSFKERVSLPVFKKHPLMANASSIILLECESQSSSVPVSPVAGRIGKFHGDGVGRNNLVAGPDRPQIAVV